MRDDLRAALKTHATVHPDLEPRPHGTPHAPAFPIELFSKCSRCEARGAGLCDAVPDEDLARLSSAATRIHIEPGQRFIEEGDEAGHFFTLTAGTAKLLKLLPDGRQQITSFADAGDFLGLAVTTAYSYTAEAVGPVDLCRFPRARLRALMTELPAMEKRLLQYTSHELVLAQEQMLLLGRKSAIERVATFLVTRARKSGLCPTRGRPAGPITIALPMTRIDIADYTGITVETVSRTITRLKHDNLIATAANSSIIIRNFSALEDLANGGATL